MIFLNNIRRFPHLNFGSSVKLSRRFISSNPFNSSSLTDSPFDFAKPVDFTHQDSFIRNPDPARKSIISEILRVDQAGEAAAVKIYEGQLWVLGNRPSDRDMLEHMRDGEVEHLKTINQLIYERRVRPTALLPVWESAGFVLGAATAALGREAAMACTVAVETTIGAHYNQQLRTLLETNYPEDDLKRILVKHRDEELEHHDKALSEGAERAPFYKALSFFISSGCKAAIEVAKKI